jgi:nickel-dependent lactate racemase
MPKGKAKRGKGSLSEEVKVRIPLGREELELKIGIPSSHVRIARSKDERGEKSYEELTKEALGNPIGTRSLRELCRGRSTVAILIDDKYRPTEAYRILPTLLEELRSTGFREEGIAIVIGTGLHDPMDEEEVAKKVGDEIASKFKTIVHNAYRTEEHTFCGFSSLGNPVWINRTVAEADMKVCVGRIAPHGDAGYEGGAKMIVPGVSALETVMHNHAMFLSPYAGIGTLDENPGRRDMDDIGGLVGIDFIVNFVIGNDGRPVKAFAGHYLRAHRKGVEYGDENVWGCEIGTKADITIASLGSDPSEHRSLSLSLGLRGLANARRGTKPGGTIVYILGLGNGEEALEGKAGETSPPIVSELARSPMEKVLRRMERRDWENPEDWLHIMRASARKARYWDHKIILTGGRPSKELIENLEASYVESPEEAVRCALKPYLGLKPRVLILPEATKTVPMEQFHRNL